MSDRLLVAPELLPGLDMMPASEFGRDIAEARAGLKAMFAVDIPEPLRGVTREERFIPGPNGAPDVRVLIYTPPGTAADRPAILHIHGGGYILGTADMMEVLNRADAIEHGCIVVSVDYRLAPETPWPGSLEDNYAALAWLHDSAAALGVDRARIAVTGESAGGGHAAALALHARDRARADPAAPRIRFLLLDAPMLDDRSGCLADPHPHAGSFVFTPSDCVTGWSALLGQPAGTADVPPQAVPARATDLSGLPPTFIGVGALDLFLEESLEWARQLTRAGVPTELHVIPGAYHGFTMVADAPQSVQFRQLKSAAMARGLLS